MAQLPIKCEEWMQQTGGIVEGKDIGPTAAWVLWDGIGTAQSGGILPMKQADFETWQLINTAGNILMEDAVGKILQEVANNVLKEY